MNTTIELGSLQLEVTDWFPGDSRPDREGVYERRMSEGAYSCWNGSVWNEDADSPADAAGRGVPSRDQHASWRGLAAPSDLPCATCKGQTIVDQGHDDESGKDLIGECPDC